jgi:hypothetical protein
MKALNENNTVVATTLLSEVADYSLDLALYNAKIELTQFNIHKGMDKFKALGFTSIQDGRRKNSAPNTGEFAYVAFAELAKVSFIARKKHIANSTKSVFITPTDKQIADFTKQFQQSVSCYLEFGIWIPNVGRDKQAVLVSAGLIKAPKESKKEGSKGTRKPSEFNAKKIADTMAIKYTDSQLEQIIVELKAMMKQD